MRVIISRAFKRRWGGQEKRQQVHRQKQGAKHLVLPGMRLLVLTQMHCAHLRKRKPMFGTSGTFIRHRWTVQIRVRTKNYITEHECAFCQWESVEDDCIMSELAAGTGQQEGRSDHQPHAGVRKSEQFPEEVEKEQRQSLSGSFGERLNFSLAHLRQSFWPMPAPVRGFNRFTREMLSCRSMFAVGDYLFSGRLQLHSLLINQRTTAISNSAQFFVRDKRQAN